MFKGGVVDPISFSSGRTHTCILLTGAIKLTKIPFGVAEFFGADNQKPLHDIYHTQFRLLKKSITQKKCNENMHYVTVHTLAPARFLKKAWILNIVLDTANRSLTENLGSNGRIGRKKQKLSTITNLKKFWAALLKLQKLFIILTILKEFFSRP